MNKKRLYEIFSKVNDITINEDVDVNEFDEIKNQIIEDIKVHFKYDNGDRAFWEGIPTEMLVRIQNNDVQFNMLEEKGFELRQNFPEQNQYDAKYSGNLEKISERLAGVDVTLIVPVIVNFEKKYIENKIQFNSEIWIESERINIEFN